jgi:hypothetical protein
MRLIDLTAVWTKLKNLYDSPSTHKYLLLKHKLYVLRLGENRPMEENLKEISNIVR